jgi:TPR repeat protein
MSSYRSSKKSIEEEDDGKRAPEDAVASIILTLGKKGPVQSDLELVERLLLGINDYKHPGCAWMLGELYLEGSKGVEQDMENAIKYLRQAAEKGFEPAISKLYVLGIPFRKMNKNIRNIDDTNHIPTSPRFVKPPYADEFNP